MHEPAGAMTLLLLMSFVFCSAVLQTIAGFGFTLTLMPLVTMALGIRTAAPLVALIALTLYLVNVVRYWRALNWREIWRLGVASALGVPAGILVVEVMQESSIKMVLGVILIGYGVLGLAQRAPGNACRPKWAYVAGFLAGALGGAYNTPGPPLAIYGSMRQWAKDEFRGALQALFLVSASLTVIAHAIAQHLTPGILLLYGAAPPALIVGILAGTRLDRRVDAPAFQRIVLGMILVLGVSLLAAAGRR
jgi:hypothetical protein